MDNYAQQHNVGEQEALPIKVILVENDDFAVVNFLKKFGTQLSIKVIESAEECFNFIKNTYPPDAIIIGRNMGGIKFLETVRQESWTNLLPVIITSEQITPGIIKEVAEKKAMICFLKILAVVIWLLDLDTSSNVVTTKQVNKPKPIF